LNQALQDLIAEGVVEQRQGVQGGAVHTRVDPAPSPPPSAPAVSW
jgi:hypothetical protein